jgi:hypothetical protein
LDRGFVTIEKSGKFHNIQGASVDFRINKRGNLTLKGDHTFTYLKDIDSSGGLELEDQATVNIGGKLDIEAGGVLEVNKGCTLNITGQLELSQLSGVASIDGTVTAGSIDISFLSLVLGSGTINGVLATNAGSIWPGLSPGILTFNSDYIQTDTGESVIEVGGSEPGLEYDQLVVNGNASLGGTLRIVPLAKFADGTIQIEPLIAERISGGFDRIIVMGESARSSFSVNLTESQVQLTPETLSLSSFTEWQNALFSETEVVDETIGFNTSDPDNDGLSNLLEYALDQNPWVSKGNPVTLDYETNASDEFSRVKVKFPWAKGMTDVTYVVQLSTDMNSWTDIEITLDDSVDGGTHDLLTVGASIEPTTRDNLFVRIQVLVLE